MRALGLALGWMMLLAIVWLSLAPSPPTLNVTWGDKLGHLGAYATLMLWFSQLYAGRNPRRAWAAAFIALGVGLEFAQAATGYRSFEWLDMVANTLGVVIGWALASQISSCRSKRRGERPPH